MTESENVAKRWRLPCPDCKAKAGEPCRPKSGTKQAEPWPQRMHQARWRVLWREIESAPEQQKDAR